LSNHVKDIVACDFFTVPTVQCRVLLVLIMLAHDRRRIVHFNTAEHPTAQWTAQQIVEAFAWDIAPRYLLRDRDAIYSHVIVLNERHLRRLLRSYADYYHHWRTHLSLEMDTPESRAVQPPEVGRVTKRPGVGGLHHHYERQAA
jgi:putative transposase